MRFAAVVLLWLLTTLLGGAGFDRLAGRAAADEPLRTAVAGELSTQAVRLLAERGHPIDLAPVRSAALDYVASPAFAAQFRAVARAGHDWVFDGAGPFTVDIAPMLRDDAFAGLLAAHDARVPDALTVPVAAPLGPVWRDRLHLVAVWGPWAGPGLAVLAGLLGAATVGAARRRGRALAGLGVGGLLIGAGGFAGMEIGRAKLAGVLNHTSGDLRRIADAGLALIEADLHDRLTAVLLGGAGLVGVGVTVALAGALRARFAR